MKKSISVVLAIIMILSIFSVNISASSTTTSEATAEEGTLINMGFTDWSNTEPANGQVLGAFPDRYYYGKTGSTVRNLIYPRISELGEGYGGSYALKIGGAYGPVDIAGGSTGKNGYQVGFRWSTPGTIEDDTEYTLKLKLKKIQGEITTFGFGLSESGNANYTLSLTDSDFTGEWQEYSFAYTTDFGSSVAASTRSWLFITYTAPVGGGTLLIDDIVVYKTSNTAKTNLFPKGSFEMLCNSYEVTSSPQENTTYCPLANADFSKYTSTSYVTNTYDFPYEYTNKTDKTSIPPRLASGVGINGSNALLIGGTTTNAVANYTVRFRLKPGVITGGTYAFSVKLKRLKGTVTTFNMGIVENSNTVYSLSLTGENFANDRYLEYSWLHTASSAADDGWTYIEIAYTAPEGGAAIYIDDLNIYSLEDKNQENLFVIYDDNGVPSDASGFDTEIVWSNEEHIGQTPVFEYAYNRKASDTNHLAHIANLEESHSGNYCLAFGFEEPETDDAGNVIPINSYIDFRMLESGNSGDTYTIKFAALMCGSPNKATITISNHGIETVELANIKTLNPSGWTEYTFTFTDNSTYNTSVAHTYMRIQYYNTTPEACEGLLIDSISVTQDALGEDAPNILYGGNFEEVTADLPEIDWTADSTFWGTDAFDLSFMDNLPKNVAAYGLTPIKGTANYLSVLNDDRSFGYFTDYILGDGMLDLSVYLAEQAVAKNKNIWITTEDIICNSDKSLKENWRDLLMLHASYMQHIAGDKFQGFYFDEPSMDFSADDFLMVTEYCRTTFRKRVLAIHKAVAVNPPANADTTRAILDAESHKYVTDVGYWKYDTWDAASVSTLAKFKETMTSGDFDPNVRKWIVPIIGRNHPCQTEEDICTLIENMVYGAMEIDGFGGVGLYALCYRIVKVAQTGVNSDSSITENAQQLLDDGIIWECTLSETVDGVTSTVPGWAYLEANGAVLLKRDLSSGLAPWNNCATLLESIAADLYGTTIHNHQIINGVVIVEASGTTVNNLGGNACLPRSYFNVYRNNSRISGATTLCTGDELRFSPPNATASRYTIAVKNDANCDGRFNIADVVRAKKASAGAVSLNTAQRASIGIADDTSAVDISTVATLRNEFMK